MLGTACSHGAVVEAALERGDLSHLDVVQLPARVCEAHPDLANRLRAAGKLVVVNSPVRRLLSSPDERACPGAVTAAYRQLLRQDAIGIVLSGTSRASHMQQCFSLLQQA